MRLGVLTDVHLCPPGTAPDGCHNPYAFDQAESLLAEAIAAHEADALDALVVLGDLANGGDASSLELAVRLLSEVDLPVWITGGNHDRDHSDELLTSLVAEAPAHLKMATSTGEPVAGMRVAGLPIASPGGGTPWRVESVPLAGWGDDTVLLLSHFPVLSREAVIVEAGFQFVGSFEGRDALEPVLCGRTAPTVVLHGHLHVRDAATSGSVLQIGCAALIEPPHERVVLEIESRGAGAVVRVRHEPVMVSPKVRLPVLSSPSSDWEFRDGTWHRVDVA